MDIKRILDQQDLYCRTGGKLGTRADLYGVNLSGANLGGADLLGANMRSADLRGANMRSAYLYGAGLYGADLGGADLLGANLSGANMRSAYLYAANLTGTVLDPTRTDHAHPEQLSALGLDVRDDGYVYGVRTARSEHVGATEYTPGQTYYAPVFSICVETTCHPGLYFATNAWLDSNDYNSYRVACRAKVTSCIVAGDKVRARELEIL